MKYIILTTLALLILLTSLSAKVVVSGNNVTMTRDDLAELTTQAALYQELKNKFDRPKIYIGVNAGTYGVGANAGVIF